jgi:hypothetical protein
MTWRPHPDVVGRRTDRAVVLVHVSANQIFELNETGARIWELISQGQSSTAVVQALTHEFEVSEAQAHEELTALVQALTAAGLLEP